MTDQEVSLEEFCDAHSIKLWRTEPQVRRGVELPGEWYRFHIRRKSDGVLITPDIRMDPPFKRWYDENPEERYVEIMKQVKKTWDEMPVSERP